MNIGALRVGRISAQPDAESLDGFRESPAWRPQFFPWTPTRFLFCADHAQEQSVHASARAFDGFIVSGMSLAELESLSNLRAIQLLHREGRFDVPSVVIVRPNSALETLPRFGQRIRSGWPFRSALFIADAATVELLRAEGLFAMDRSEARRSSLAALLGRSEGVFQGTLADQLLAVQIQPPWPYGGSHTVFANQTDALLDRNCFVLRIVVDPETGIGPTMRRRMAFTIADANVDTAPHLDTVACSDGAPEAINESDADELYRRSVRNRMRTVIADDLAARLAARADIAVVNYTVHMAFALKACPMAKLILETHDDITRMNVRRPRVLAGQASFPTTAAVKRHLKLERSIWKAADVCIALSLSDLTRIRRQVPRCVYVLPKPYVRQSREATGGAEWDILIVMNPHHFNVPSLDAFLEHVILPDPRLAALKIAVAGRIKERLEADWKNKLPNTHWLGFVEDVDALRDVSRLSVCPDLHGTGVAIKALAAIAAGHPLVATRTALRGLPDTVLDLIPPAVGTAEMQQQILDLVTNEDLLQERRRNVARASELLWPATGHAEALIQADGPLEDKSRQRAQLLAAIESGPAPASVVDPDADCALIRFGTGGNDRPYLGRGWLHDEPGGRWSDGSSATLRLPAKWLSSGGVLILSFMLDFRGFDVGVACDGAALRVLAKKGGRMLFALDAADRIADEFVELEIVRSQVFCPKDAGHGDDERILGVHVRSIEIVRGGLSARLLDFSRRARRTLNQFMRR